MEPSVEQEDQETKSAALSKTHWANLLLACSTELFPQVQPWIASHPQSTVTLIAIMNMALRQFSTPTKLTVLPRRKALCETTPPPN